ncbi:MAG: Ig-like domain-containing protein, partial [Bacteroidota bacterium]
PSERLLMGESITLDRWHHIALVFNSSGSSINNNAQFFINGEPGAVNGSMRNISPIFISNQTNIFLGNDGINSGVSDFTGYLDELRIWNIARTPAQIKENMDTVLTGSEDRLIGYWQFDEDDADPIRDNSINDNNAAPTNNRIDVTPVAVNDVATFDQDEVRSIDVLANDIENSNGSLLASLLPNYPLNGTASVVNNQIQYTPDLDFFGTDTIRYLALDTTSIGYDASCDSLIEDCIGITSAEAEVIVVVGCRMKDQLTWGEFDASPSDSSYIKYGLFVSFDLHDTEGIVTQFDIANSLQSKDSYVWTHDAGNVSQTSQTTIHFANATDHPINQLCIELLNVDSVASYQDGVVVNAYSNGTLIDLTAANIDASSSPSVTLVGGNTLIGTTSVTTTGTEGNATICLDAPVDSIVLTLTNQLSGPLDPDQQTIAIGDINWCSLPNNPPVIVDSTDMSTPVSSVENALRVNSSIEVCLDVVESDFDAVNIAPIVSTEGTVETNNTSGSTCFLYTPPEGFIGTDVLRVSVCDVRPIASCAEVEVNIEVLPYDLPTASSDSSELIQNQLQVIDVQQNDSVPSGGALITAIVSGPDNGTVEVLNGDSIVYSPEPLFHGIDRLTYVICDNSGLAGSNACDSALVILSVLPDDAINVLDIAQAISPNGDGILDTWVVPQLEFYPDNSVEIYNVLGDLIFKEAGYNNQDRVWAGQVNRGSRIGGNIVPNGTYYYVIELGNGSPKRSGFVVLKR